MQENPPQPPRWFGIRRGGSSSSISSVSWGVFFSSSFLAAFSICGVDGFGDAVSSVLLGEVSGCFQSSFVFLYSIQVVYSLGDPSFSHLILNFELDYCSGCCWWSPPTMALFCICSDSDNGAPWVCLRISLCDGFGGVAELFH
ncbi:hypothetical protein F2Q70_00038962 [Brassica cretica]|uniref:Uncharacterized protein n=1 Tax=Brassica cretica TaxID=69181 RepID=A0A8S9K3N7_BRACR|nr:hypothetical protein F2Q70_00038962 [Brassica cretica]